MLVFEAFLIKIDTMDNKTHFISNPSITVADDTEFGVNRNWKIFLSFFSPAYLLIIDKFSSDIPQYDLIPLIFATAYWISYIGLVFLLAYYAFKFSGKKIWLLNGISGLLSIFIFPPIIGLLIIFLLKRKKIKALAAA